MTYGSDKLFNLFYMCSSAVPHPLSFSSYSFPLYILNLKLIYLHLSVQYTLKMKVWMMLLVQKSLFVPLLKVVCPCRYIAAIEGSVSKRHLQRISGGTFIDGIHCIPDSVELLPAQPHDPKPRLRIVVAISVYHVNIYMYVCV